jgi:hypothetical protein
MAASTPPPSEDQLLVEARAKIIWGESPASVHAWLLANGLGEKSARDLLARLARERAATIRNLAVDKIVRGLLLMLVPVAGLVVFLCIGLIFEKILAVLMVIGFFGLWKFVSGLVELFFPSTKTGDLSHRAD